MLALVKRPKNIEVEAEDQRPANAEVGGQRLADARAQRSESPKGPKFKSGSSRPAGSGPELEDK